MAANADSEGGAGFLVGLDPQERPPAAMMKAVAAHPADALFFAGSGSARAVPVAYFFDYYCPYCRVLSGHLGSLVAKSEVALSRHRWPIFGEPSELAARASLAAEQQDGGAALHARLLSTSFRVTPAYLRDMAEDLGLSWPRLQRAMVEPAVTAALHRSQTLAHLFTFIGSPLSWSDARSSRAKSLKRVFAISCATSGRTEVLPYPIRKSLRKSGLIRKPFRVGHCMDSRPPKAQPKRYRTLMITLDPPVGGRCRAHDMSSDTKNQHLLTRLPEIDFAVFSFLFHFVWEFLQVPLYADMPESGHWQGVVTCTRATAGDVFIALAAFWGTAAYARSRQWVFAPRKRDLVVFLGLGLLATVGLEYHATEIANRWSYAPQMPRLPVLGTGMAPVMQWLVLPLLVLFYTRRLAPPSLFRTSRSRGS